MKLIAKTFVTRLWMVFLLTGLGMVSVSAVASALIPGDEYGGGIVMYIDRAGQHGLIAAKADLPGTVSWDDAKKACDDLVENGYDDWYLPNAVDISRLYSVKARFGIGGFTDYFYWTSLEDSATSAWFLDFSSGKGFTTRKSSKCWVRPVRAF